MSRSHVLFVIAQVLLTVVAPHAFGDDNSAPLGLTWGASVDEVRALGVDLQAIPKTDFGESFSASKLPRALSDQENALLSFGYDNKLWRIVAVSHSFDHDPHGNAVKARYQQLLGALTEKYGKPSSVHSLGDSIFATPEYFIAGIRSGKSFWYSNLSGPDVNIQIGIHGESSDSARWTIFYENTKLKKAFDENKRLKEKNSL